MQRRKPEDARADVRSNTSNRAVRARFEPALDTHSAPPFPPRRRHTPWSDFFWLLLSAVTALLWFADTRPRARSTPAELPAESAGVLAPPAPPPAPERVEPAAPRQLAASAPAPDARGPSRRALHKRAKRRAKVLATRTKPKQRQHAAKPRPRG